ncbi:MAG: IniB N-terminal domain-containing protein [Pseudonocardiaceae bacterium]
MLSASSLIDFLMSLLRDEAATAEFERDPQAMLARHGLDDLCGQDVRDVAPLVADHGAVQASSTAPVTAAPGDDPITEITHITKHYQLDPTVVRESNEYNYTYVDDRDTIVNVDDRDSTTIVADGDVTIEDSFNQDNDVNVIEDSFNQDNDGVDNKGGTIDDSTVAGDDIEDSLNSDDDTTVSDSYNADSSETNIDASDDDTTTTTTTDSYKQDNDQADIDLTEQAPTDADAAA